MIALRLCGWTACFLAWAASGHAQLTEPVRKPLRGARMPALSPDGKRLAFVYRGDIWSTQAKGGKATPLTLHIEMDAYPLFSPDAKWVAFASKRHGNWDIFAVPSIGGAAQRLTFHNGSEIPTGWSPDGTWILFGTRRDAPAYGLYGVNVETLQTRLFCEDYASLNHPSWSGDQRKLVYGRYGFHWTRPRYHGSGASELWVLDVDTQSRHAVTDSGRQHLWPQFLPDQEHVLTVCVGEETPSASTLENVIPKVEDHPLRTPNLWRFDLEGAGEQLTHFTGGGVRCPTVASESGDIAFEYEEDLWLLPTGQEKPSRIRLFAAVDEKETGRQSETIKQGATEAEPSPDGKTVAFGLRRDIWTIPVDKPDGVAGRNAEFAERLTDWVGDDSDFSWSRDGKKLYFTSDRRFNNRVFELDIESLDVSPVWNRMEDVTGLKVSPKGDHLTFWVAGSEGGLWLWTLATGEARRLVKVPGAQWRGNGGGNFAWSPDQQWIAYTFYGESRVWNIWIVPVQGGDPVNVTQLYAHHSQPTWSPDGKYLFFQSNRDGAGLYVLPLVKEPVRSDDTDIKFSKPDGDVQVVIDFEDITRRIRKLASQNPDDDLTITRDGTLFFLSQGDVWSASYDGKTVRRLTNGGGKSALRLAGEDRKVFHMQNGELWTMNADGKGGKKVEFTAEWDRDVRAERQAAFTQFWRSYHRGFYDPNFHGRDWEGIRQRYEPRLDGVETSEEFATLLQMMVGELETSHAEVKPASGGPSSPTTPHVGFTFDYTYEGPGLRVAKVPEGVPAWYPETRIEEGDYVLEINGEPVTAGERLYDRINNKHNREFEFLVNDRPEREGARSVKYKVLSQDEWRDLLYNNHVADLREHVEDRTGDRVGYIHISAMGRGNQVQFERETYEYMVGKEAMIIDVRFNSGGNIADTLIDWLERKPHGYVRPRDASPQVSPQRAWTKPIVVVLNEHSFSNAEIFSYAMRERGLARLVGQPTPGYVIWTSDLSLVDGTQARMPQSGSYRMDGTTQENNGEVPDYPVALPPEDWLAGRDPQIDRAIDLLFTPTPEGTVADKEKQDATPAASGGSER